MNHGSDHETKPITPSRTALPLAIRRDVISQTASRGGSRRGEPSHDGQGFGKDGRVNERKRLQKVIRDLHGVNATHLRSELAKETSRGEVVLDGVVEVLALKGQPKAGMTYARSHKTDESGRRYVAILGVPPTDAPEAAERAAIATEIKRHPSP